MKRQPDHKAQRIAVYFKANPTATLQQAATELGVSYTYTSAIVRRYKLPCGKDPNLREWLSPDRREYIAAILGCWQPKSYREVARTFSITFITAKRFCTKHGITIPSLPGFNKHEQAEQEAIGNLWCSRGRHFVAAADCYVYGYKRNGNKMFVCAEHYKPLLEKQRIYRANKRRHNKTR